MNAVWEAIVEAVEPIIDDEGVAIEKIMYITLGTYMENGMPAFNYGSWDRNDGDGLTYWDMLGMMEYLKARMAATLDGLLGDDEE